MLYCSSNSLIFFNEAIFPVANWKLATMLANINDSEYDSFPPCHPAKNPACQASPAPVERLISKLKHFSSANKSPFFQRKTSLAVCKAK